MRGTLPLLVVLPVAMVVVVAACTPTSRRTGDERAVGVSNAPCSLDPASAACRAATNVADNTQPHVHPDFDAGRISFSVRAQGIESSLGILSTFVMPAATLDIEAVGGSGAFVASASDGTLTRTGPSSWTWTAPLSHGDRLIRIRDRQDKTGEEARLRVFVLHPLGEADSIRGYRIGRYPSRPKDDDEAYLPPKGLVEVTAANVDTPVSPHFRLGQFVCKQGDEYPKYVLLRTPLLVKLEALLEALAARGLPASSLHVMSGYRTPAYNSGIGNETTYSRHGYGDAADVFLDRDGDGVEDDLNGDGRSTREDARILYQLVEDTLDSALPGQMAGGLSAYGPTSAHGPFLHVDTRGKKARW